MQELRSKPWGALALVFVGGCGALASTFLTWHIGPEGVYFNGSGGAPAYAAVFGAFDEDAWKAFGGLAIALAAFAGVAAAVVPALLRAPASRLTLIALTTSLIGVAIGAWIIQVAFSRPGLIGLGPGPVIGFASIVVAVGGVWLGAASRTGQAHRLRATAAPVSASVGGLVVVASTFLHWHAGVAGGHATRSFTTGAEAGVVSIWGPAQNAWAAFAGLDLALVLFGALAVAAGLLA